VARPSEPTGVGRAAATVAGVGEAPRFVEVTGARFAYLAAGRDDGPLVVCLHGFPDHAESFAPLLARLAGAGFRAVAPWMRGYAPSTLAGPHHGEQLADDALAIARALAGGRRFALVGHDWGALAVWAACARAPADLACAITMAVPHPLATAAYLARRPSQLRRSWYIGFFQLPRLPEWALARRDFALVDRLWRDWSPGFALDAGARRRLHRCLAASLPAPLAYYRALPRQLLALRRPPALAGAPADQRIATPVLYLHGADDGCIEPGAAARQARFMRGPFGEERVAHAGHFLHLEQPDAVGAHIIAWLRAHPA
jgi:pimeloyl-ACP methyl ester carboxylesterase